MEAQVLGRDTERTMQEAFDRLPFLEPVVKDTLREFVRRVKDAEGDNLLRVVLFGSMARGDFDEESDTDVFVLLRSGSVGTKIFDIAAIAYDVASDVFDLDSKRNPFVLISAFIETEESLAITIGGVPRRELEPIFEEIKEDGVLLYAGERSHYDGVVG